MFNSVRRLISNTLEISASRSATKEVGIHWCAARRKNLKKSRFGFSVVVCSRSFERVPRKWSRKDNSSYLLIQHLIPTYPTLAAGLATFKDPKRAQQQRKAHLVCLFRPAKSPAHTPTHNASQGLKAVIEGLGRSRRRRPTTNGRRRAIQLSTQRIHHQRSGRL